MLGNVVRSFSLVQGWHVPEVSQYRTEAAYKMPLSTLSLRGWLSQPKQSRVDGQELDAHLPGARNGKIG